MLKFVLACAALLSALPLVAQPFQLPTANRALFDADGGADRFFVPTVGRTWESGTYGCVRSSGTQLHEGLDIRALQRDRRGEATDPILATAAGTVAYISRKPALSNYGIYIVIRHEVDGLEIYSLYAHLSEVRADLRPGATVAAGETIGVMGRTANTSQGISKDRAHVHFELNIFLSERFPAWYKKTYPKQRDDHGQWNGQNLLGFDPLAVFHAQRTEGAKFNLVRFLQRQPELCRVLVRTTDFPWLKRYAPLVHANPRAAREGVAGYELVLNFTGIPIAAMPRAASEIQGKAKVQLLSVNEAEQRANPCRKLVTKRNGRWDLAPAGLNLIELLTH
jgi:murein DD-endopeptidase MepM/ murein hydrolase activator NlpD